MIASICPFCRSSLRQGEPEVPKVLMDAVAPRTGYDRSKEPVVEREPVLEPFDLQKFLIRFVVYAGVIWIASSIAISMLLPANWADVLLDWTFLASVILVLFYGKRIEEFLD
jgi:hypothetical protein